MAAESNSLMLAIFKFGVRCLLFLCQSLCWKGQGLAGGLSPGIVAANSAGLRRDTGCCSFGSLPRADATPQVAFNTVGQKHEC